MELSLYIGRGKRRRNYLNSINILECCSSWAIDTAETDH